MTIRNTILAGVLPYGFLDPITRHGPRVALAPDDGNGGAGDPPSGAAGGGDGAGGDSGVGAGGSAGTGGVPGEQAGAGEGKSLLAGAVEGKSGEGAEGQGGDKPAEGEGGKPAGQQAKPAPADQTKDVDGNAIPEAYDIKAPDGMEIDKDLLAEVTPQFKDAKLSPKQAQVVADAYTNMQRKAIETHQKTVENWTKDSRNDPEFGRADLAANLGHANRAVEAFGTPGFVEVMDRYGLGNHPEILRFCVRAGKAIGEGGTVLPGGGIGRKSTAEVLYPSMSK